MCKFRVYEFDNGSHGLMPYSKITGEFDTYKEAYANYCTKPNHDKNCTYQVRAKFTVFPRFFEIIMNSK